MTALALTAEPKGDESDWLAWRREGIGASESPCVLGKSPYRTAQDLYFEKKGLGDAQEETEAMRIGTAAEPMLADLYQQQTGRVIAQTQVRVAYGPAPFLRATLDGVTTDGRLVEFKMAGGPRAAELGEDGTDEIHDDWIIQGQQQMLCAGFDVVDFAVLSGGLFGFRFRIFTLARDPEWDGILIDAGADFMDRLVRNDPPPAVLPDDNRNLKRLLRPNGAEIVLPGSVAAEALRWEEVGKAVSTLQKERKEIEATLRAGMGEASFGKLPDGRELRRYVQEMAERTSVVKAHVRDYLQITKGRS